MAAICFTKQKVIDNLMSYATCENNKVKAICIAWQALNIGSQSKLLQNEIAFQFVL